MQDWFSGLSARHIHILVQEAPMRSAAIPRQDSVKELKAATAGETRDGVWPRGSAARSQSADECPPEDASSEHASLGSEEKERPREEKMGFPRWGWPQAGLAQAFRPGTPTPAPPSTCCRATLQLTQWAGIF